jgi:hypothetical protein
MSKSAKNILTFNIEYLHDVCEEIIPCGSQKFQHFHAGTYLAKHLLLFVYFTFYHIRIEDLNPPNKRVAFGL